MSILYTFPFSAISDFGTNKTIAGTVTVSLPDYNLSITKSFSLASQTWAENQATDSITLEVDDGVITDNTVTFTISTALQHSDDIVLLYPPTANDNTNIYYRLRHDAQSIPATNFTNTKNWFNLPLRLEQTATVKLKVIVEDSINDVVDFLADQVVYRKELTYVTREQNKPNMSAEDNIEYYLGKDKFKNLFFNTELPTAWEIPARTKNTMFKPLQDITVNASDGKEYKYNNLGYRANFDYTVDTLKDKDIILCLGDSDLFGFGLDYNNTWSELLQERMPSNVLLNMGIKGISADTITRVGVKTITTLPTSISAVCVHWPHTSLREFVSKKYKSNIHTHRNYDLPYADWWDHIDWQSNNYNFHKNRILLESVCAKFGIPFYDLTINKDDTRVPLDRVEFGIYTSIGPLTHQAIANYFYKKINNLPGLFETTQS